VLPLAALLPALAGLAGAWAMAVARGRAAVAAPALAWRRLPLLPAGAPAQVRWAARWPQAIFVVPLAACTFAALLLPGADPTTPVQAQAAALCGAALLALGVPLLLAERTLASLPAATLPEEPSLRALVFLPLLALPSAGLLEFAAASGLAQAAARLASLLALSEPGLAWKLPAPLQDTTVVDLRLRTSSTGLNDVGTRDGLRILLQAYVAWQVPADPDRIRQFLRAVRNDPDEAARQLRSFVGSALQVTASSFDFSELVNTDPARLRLADFERRLQAQVAAQVLQTYGSQVRQAGIEVLSLPDASLPDASLPDASLPDASLTATVARMRSDRETVAAERTAEGRRVAAEVRSDAERDGRIVVARGHTEAADIEAAARRQAAEIRTRAYLSDPQLYDLLRSLDTLAQTVGPGTRLVLCTDAAPFAVLMQAPSAAAAAPRP